MNFEEWGKQNFPGWHNLDLKGYKEHLREAWDAALKYGSEKASPNKQSTPCLDHNDKMQWWKYCPRCGERY